MNRDRRIEGKRMMRAEQFLNEDQRRMVGEALLGVNSWTASKIAVTVLDRSNRYLEARILGAFIAAGVFSIIVAAVSDHLNVWFFISMVVLLVYPAKRLLELFPSVQMLLVSKRRVEEAVRQKAIQTFYEKGLHRSPDGSGILIFISLLEHKVWILGDRKIKEKVLPRFWQELTDRLAEGIKENRSCEALCEVISRCEGMLRLYSPKGFHCER